MTNMTLTNDERIYLYFEEINFLVSQSFSLSQNIDEESITQYLLDFQNPNTLINQIVTRQSDLNTISGFSIELKINRFCRKYENQLTASDVGLIIHDANGNENYALIQCKRLFPDKISKFNNESIYHFTKPQYGRLNAIESQIPNSCYYCFYNPILSAFDSLKKSIQLKEKQMNKKIRYYMGSHQIAKSINNRPGIRIISIKNLFPKWIQKRQISSIYQNRKLFDQFYPYEYFLFRLINGLEGAITSPMISPIQKESLGKLCLGNISFAEYFNIFKIKPENKQNLNHKVDYSLSLNVKRD